jgi:acyl carrier protein
LVILQEENLHNNTRELVYEAIDQVNAGLQDEPPITKSDDAMLLSEEGKIDSLTFVNLVIALEGVIQQETGKTIVLVDDSAFDGEENHFETVGSLVSYTKSRLSTPDE